MSRDAERRVLTLLLLMILGAAALRAGEPKTVALTLVPIAALLMPVVTFYFPRCRCRRARERLTSAGA